LFLGVVLKSVTAVGKLRLVRVEHENQVD
jgi:hypothetical protein